MPALSPSVEMRKSEHASGPRIELQRALIVTDDDRRLGTDRYCLVNEGGVTHYGGLEIGRSKTACLSSNSTRKRPRSSVLKVALRRMAGMRTVVILATLSFGAVRIMLRALNPADPRGSGMEWTADE